MNNPVSIINQAMNDPNKTSNPIFANAIKMYKSGDAEGLRNLAINLCNSKGITPESILKNIK